MIFYGQFNPSVDKFIFERYFPDLNIKGVFVECGAYDGLTECSCKFFEETMGWTGYNFEPVPWIFEKLCTNRPISRNLNFALSNTIGNAKFKAVDHPLFGVECTNGSLAHTDIHTKWLEDTGCSFVDVEVRLRTWVDFIAEENIKYIDLLVLDVEGHELSVIEGMAGCSVLPDVICIEVGHLSFVDIRNSLVELGYVYDVSSHVNAFFVHQSKLSLFVMRRSGSSALNASEENSGLLSERNGELVNEINALKDSLREIKRSKAWRLVEAYRRLNIFSRKLT